MKRELPESFDILIQEYYYAWFCFHPEQAVEAGVEGYWLWIHSLAAGDKTEIW